MEKEKHAGGRPPIYDRNDPRDVALLKLNCESYFDSIKGGTEENGGLIMPKPPTVTGLTLHLGFCHKDTLYAYRKIEEFSDSIKRGLSKIEQFHEESVAMGDKCTGNIFILKNFGWKDKTETDINMKQDIVWHEEKTYETKEEDGLE